VDRAADLTDCNKGPTGDLCLLAPIDLDINGKPVEGADAATWSGTLPDGTADSPNCANWTSNSNNDQGSGGGAGLLDKEWTTGVQGSCDQGRRLICFLFQSSG
jgi:hypothetical protein